jgi:hypothetical protein
LGSIPITRANPVIAWRVRIGDDRKYLGDAGRKMVRGRAADLEVEPLLDTT